MPYTKILFQKHIFISSIAMVALSTTACAPVKEAQQTFKETFANDDPCSNNARNIGIFAGGILGAIVANQVGNDKAASALGVAIGAGIGGLIGHDIDSRRCELHKISQKYKIPIQAQPITLTEAGLNNPSGSKYSEDDTLGLKVNLQDTGKQFLTGSSQLTPTAEQYFTEIAKSYSPKYNQSKNKTEKQILDNRQILVIGHTDDVGNSNSNALLAEKRAKTVANLFAKYGVKKTNIHYQGAGETQPIADNRTPTGRAKNRRAEIIDLPDTQALQSYLNNRKPVVAFYRTTAPVNTTKNTKTSSSVSKNQVASTQAKMPSKTMQKSYKAWNFEGQQLSNSNANISIGNIIPEKEQFAWTSLIGIKTAQAQSNSVYESSCAFDRPRTSRGVKSLATNKEEILKTKDYLPGLNKTVWQGIAGKHTLAIANIAVARDGSIPTANPDVYFYKSKTLTKNSKPGIKTKAYANAYRGENGILYRLFLTDKKSPVQCIDIVMPNKAPFNAQSGYIIYPENKHNYVANYKPSKL